MYRYASNECPQIQTVNDLNLTEYIRAPWYIQMQQVTPYLPKNSNYCVFARYNTTQRHVPFLVEQFYQYIIMLIEVELMVII